MDLSEEQRMEYYKQYEEIVNEINSGEPNSVLGLEPFEEFAAEDFVEPSEFKEYAIERANVNFNIVSDSDTGINPLSTAYGSKSKTVNSNGASVSVNITGSFTTQYSSLQGRQLFASVNSITTKPSKGTWKKSTTTGYTAVRLDGSRTYQITVSGKITISNLSSSHHITVEFTCGSDGSVG